MASANDGIRFRQLSPVEAEFITPSSTQPITLKTAEATSPITIETLDSTSDINVSSGNDIILIAGDDFSLEGDNLVGTFFADFGITSVTLSLLADPGPVMIGSDTLPTGSIGDVLIKSGDVGASTGDIVVDSPAGLISLRTHLASENISLVSSLANVYFTAGNQISGYAGTDVDLEANQDVLLTARTAYIFGRTGSDADNNGVTPNAYDIALLTAPPTGSENANAIRLLSSDDIIIQARCALTDHPSTTGGILLDVENALLASGATSSLATDQQNKITLCSVDGFESHVEQNTSVATRKVIRYAHGVKNCIVEDSTGIVWAAYDTDRITLGTTGSTLFWWFDRLPWNVEIVEAYVEYDAAASGAEFDIALGATMASALGPGTEIIARDASLPLSTGVNYVWCHYDNVIDFVDLWEDWASKPNFADTDKWLHSSACISRSSSSGQIKWNEVNYFLRIEKVTNNTNVSIDKIVVAYRAKGSYP